MGRPIGGCVVVKAPCDAFLCPPAIIWAEEAVFTECCFLRRGNTTVMTKLEPCQVEEEYFRIMIAKGEDWVKVRIRRTWCEEAEAHVERVTVRNLKF